LSGRCRWQCGSGRTEEIYCVLSPQRKENLAMKKGLIYPGLPEFIARWAGSGGSWLSINVL